MFLFTLVTIRESTLYFLKVNKLTRQKGVRKRVKHHERCKIKIVKSEKPSGVIDFTILHLSRC